MLFFSLERKKTESIQVKLSRNEYRQYFLQNYSCHYAKENTSFRIHTASFLKNKKELVESHFTCITMQKRSKFLFSSKRIQNNTVKYNLRLMKTFLDSFAISFLEAEAVCFGYLVPVSIQPC